MVYDDKITHILYIQHVDADDACCFSPLELPEKHVKRKKMCNSSIKKWAVMFGLVLKASKLKFKFGFHETEGYSHERLIKMSLIQMFW